MCNWFSRDLYVFAVILAMISIGTFAVPAMAEGGTNSLGNKAFGANRRVRSIDGFVGIDTFFSPPSDFNVPAQYDKNNNYIDGSNANNSKPSFYVGMGNGSQEIDAGIQWEFETKQGGIKGWSAFISWDHGEDKNHDGKKDGNKYTNPLMYGHSVRIPSFGGSFVDLKCQATPTGGVNLYVGTQSQVFSFYWDDSGHNSGDTPGYAIFETNSNGGITHSAVNSMSVKRIVAITQQGANQNDGSYMKDVGCNTLYLATPSFDENYKLVPQWSSTVGWPITDVDQDETKYISGYDEMLNWKVDFNFEGMVVPEIRGPNDPHDPDGTYRDQPVQTRYNYESVSISLRKKPSWLKGMKVEHKH